MTPRRTAPARLLLALALALGATACSTSSTDDADDAASGSSASSPSMAADGPGATTGLTDSTVKVAVLVPDFGTLAGTGLVPDLGDPEAQVRAYVDHVNDTGGMAGRTIELSFHGFDPADSSGTSARAACIAATEEEKAFAVIGMPSWPAVGALCVAEEHETPMVMATSLVPSILERTGGRVFSLPMDLTRMFGGWAKVLADRGALDGKTVGIVVGDSDGTLSEAVEVGLEPALEELGVDVAEKILLPCQEMTCEQHENAVEKLRAAGVDLVFDVLGAVSSPTFISAAIAAGYEPDYTFSSTLLNDTVAGFHEGVAADLDGMLGVGDYGPPNPGQPSENSAFFDACVGYYEAASGEQLEGDAAGMAEQGCILVEMLRRGAENADELGQDSLVRGIEAIGELDVSAVPGSACNPGPGNPSFGPDKHDGVDWLLPVVFDGATSQFLREESCGFVKIDA